MRKSLSLVVVSLLAFTGCAAPATVESAPAVVTEASEPKARTGPPKVAPVNPDAGTEKMFYEFALTRATAHDVPKDPTAKAVAAALHSFCEDGKPFNVSTSSVLNDNLQRIADKSYCDMLAR
jgi:hypothetical protein